MNEEQVQRMIAEVFEEFAQRVEYGTTSTPLHLVEGNDQTNRVAEMARETAKVIRPPDPELLSEHEAAPVTGHTDPFAPKHTLEHWTEKIRSLIEEAEADGYWAVIGNNCCGCSYGYLYLCDENDTEAFVWGTEK